MVIRVAKLTNISYARLSLSSIKVYLIFSYKVEKTMFFPLGLKYDKQNKLPLEEAEVTFAILSELC